MVTYNVRVYCDTNLRYERKAQNTVDATWVPDGDTAEDIRDFVIEWIDEA